MSYRVQLADRFGQSGEQEISLSPGFHELRGSIEMKDGMRLVGDERENSLLCFNTGSRLVIDGTCVIRDVTLRICRPMTGMVEIWGGEEILFENVRFESRVPWGEARDGGAVAYLCLFHVLREVSLSLNHCVFTGSQICLFDGHPRIGRGSLNIPRDVEMDQTLIDWDSGPTEPADPNAPIIKSSAGILTITRSTIRATETEHQGRTVPTNCVRIGDRDLRAMEPETEGNQLVEEENIYELRPGRDDPLNSHVLLLGTSGYTGNGSRFLVPSRTHPGWVKAPVARDSSGEVPPFRETKAWALGE